MTVADMTRTPAGPTLDRGRSAAVAAGAAGAAILGGLALVLASGVPAAVGVVVAGAGVLTAVVLLVPVAVRALVRVPGLAFVVVLAGLATFWMISGLQRAGQLPDGLNRGFHAPSGILYPYGFYPYERFRGLAAGSTGWPWEIGRISVLPLVVALLSATGGLVLLADAVRLGLGLAPLAQRQRAPWRVMTATDTGPAPSGWRMVPGVLLILLAAFLAIGLADRYAAGNALLQALVLLGVGGWTAVLIGGPFLVGALMRIDRDKAGRARDEERQRFAAHLHDSVLQTLALVQRQAHDPAAVVRLARRQEHALRAWMAGESELASETLAAALREIVAEVEDEYRDDRRADRHRRPAARSHGRGARRRRPGGAAQRRRGTPPGRRCTCSARSAASGPRCSSATRARALTPTRWPTSGAGIRDAMIGRMAVSGGRATIESTPGRGDRGRAPARAGRGAR